MNFSKTIPIVVAFVVVCGCQGKSSEAPAKSEASVQETAFEAPPEAPAAAEGGAVEEAGCRGDADCLTACKDAGDEIAKCAETFRAGAKDAADTLAEPERLEEEEAGAAPPAQPQRKMKSRPAPSAPAPGAGGLKGTGDDENSVRPHEYSD